METNGHPEVLLTSEAIAQAHAFVARDPKLSGKSLRLYLDGKGCDGFYYGVTFDEASPEDLHFPQGGIDLIVDPQTFEFVRGSTIGWATLDIGEGFLVDNPRQRHFRGKFFKRSSWQAKLMNERDQDQR